MEFADCLVYNFFKSSSLGNDWRVLYSIVNPNEPHPIFNQHKHGILCVELKLLYVLVTRARQNLIIFDEDIDASEPFLQYWLSHKIIEKKVLDDNIRNLFRTASSKEEWDLRGEQFLERRQYMNAKVLVIFVKLIY